MFSSNASSTQFCFAADTEVIAKTYAYRANSEAFARYQALNGLARAAIGDFFYTILLPG